MRTSGFWLLAWDQPRQRERPTRNSEFQIEFRIMLRAAVERLAALFRVGR